MKIVFKKLLQYYLKYITKLALFIHRPVIIAIAGSTNKTFVKDAINEMLREEGIKVRSNPKSFNTEIGLPLAILNLPSGYNSYKDWLPIIFKTITRIFAADFPKILVLELGVSDKGNMKYLLSIISPKIAVITDITRRYIEGFDYIDELVGEYEYLAKKMKNKSLLVLNYDNIRIRELFKNNLTKIEFFSIHNNTNQNPDNSLWQAVKISKVEDGQIVDVEHNNAANRHKIGRFGEHHVYALLASLIVKNYV